jgi:ankyrin repeat protein
VHYGSLESLDLLLAHGGEFANAKLMHAATAGGSVSAMARVLELGVDIIEGDDALKTGIPT